MNVEGKVLSFFKSKGKMSGCSTQEYLNCEYLDTGILDSMQFVEMIVFLEDEFKIRFSSEDLQSQEFRKIGSVIEIVKRLLNKKMNPNNA